MPASPGGSYQPGCRCCEPWGNPPAGSAFRLGGHRPARGRCATLASSRVTISPSSPVPVSPAGEPPARSPRGCPGSQAPVLWPVSLSAPRRAAPRPRPPRGPFHRRPVSHQPARTELLELCGCARAADLPVLASQARATPARGPGATVQLRPLLVRQRELADRTSLPVPRHSLPSPCHSGPRVPAPPSSPPVPCAPDRRHRSLQGRPGWNTRAGPATARRLQLRGAACVDGQLWACAPVGVGAVVQAHRVAKLVEGDVRNRGAGCGAAVDDGRALTRDAGRR